MKYHLRATNERPAVIGTAADFIALAMDRRGPPWNIAGRPEHAGPDLAAPMEAGSWKEAKAAFQARGDLWGLDVRHQARRLRQVERREEA